MINQWERRATKIVSERERSLKRSCQSFGDPSCSLLQVTFDLPQHELHTGASIFETVMTSIWKHRGRGRLLHSSLPFLSLHLLTCAVLNESLQVLCHKGLEGSFEGRTLSVREHNGRVHHTAVDDLEREGGGREEQEG